MLYAVIPAAGKSERMGSPKPLLPLAGVPIIQWTLGALRQAGIRQTVVVVAPALAELAETANGNGAHVLVLPAETPHMRASVEAGLDWLDRHCRPFPNDGWLLVPADHPIAEPGVIEQLSAARDHNADRSIFVPTFDGKRGHPVFLGWEHAAALRGFSPDRGINEYIRAAAAATVEVPVRNPSVLDDLDTPEEFERVRRRWPAPGSE